MGILDKILNRNKGNNGQTNEQQQNGGSKKTHNLQRQYYGDKGEIRTDSITLIYVGEQNFIYEYPDGSGYEELPTSIYSLIDPTLSNNQNSLQAYQIYANIDNDLLSTDPNYQKQISNKIFPPNRNLKTIGENGGYAGGLAVNEKGEYYKFRDERIQIAINNQKTRGNENRQQSTQEQDRAEASKYVEQVRKELADR